MRFLLKHFMLKLLIWLAVSSQILAAASTTNVPKKYARLYAELEQVLDDQLSKLDVPGKTADAFKPILCVDLLAANSNRGPALLRPDNMEIVRLSLDRFKALGIQCVKFAVQYPLLRPDFFHAPEYLAFYRDVVKEAHTRQIKVMPHITVLFSDTPFSPFQGIYKGLDLNRFKREYRDMVHLVVRELHPDFLVLLTEPDTHARLMSLAELNIPGILAEVVQFVLKGLDRGKTLVGAGSGSWSPPAFAETLAGLPEIDFIAIHVYPITGAMLSNVRKMARIAHMHGKQAFIDEAWLYKTMQPGGGENVAATANVFRQDVFSYWQPLDKKFITLILGLAEQERIGLVSFFWSSLLFGYLDYVSELESLSYAELNRRHNQVVYKNMQDGKYSLIGEFLRQVVGP